MEPKKQEKPSAQTGRARVIQAMDGGRPDRLPLAPMMDRLYLVRSTGWDPFDWAYRGFEKKMEITLAAHHRHHADILQLWGERRRDDPNRLRAENGQRFVVDLETGERTRLPDPGGPPWDSIVKNPAWQEDLEVSEYDFSGDGSQSTNKKIKRVVKRFVRTLDEVATHMQPVISAEAFAANGGTDAVQYVVEAMGKEAFVNAGTCSLAPDLRLALGGEVNAFVAMAEEPRLVEAILDHLMARYAEEIKALARAGADGIRMMAYYEGADLISPRMWRRYFYPHHQAFCDLCHEHSVRAVLWFLGDCLPLVEDIARAGYDMLHIEQDRRGYSSDPVEFRKRIGTDLCITGWTYELDMISGNREAISKTIRHQIETAGREGAFIYGSTFVGADVAPETVDFMYEEVRRIWGETQGSSASV